MAQFKIKKLRSGGLITNYFCTSSCKHCLYNCSPQWEKRYIDPVTVENSLKTARKLGCPSVHIGGGKPLLRPEKLAAVLEIADTLGVSVEYVETNSSWFKDPDSATDLLLRLRKQGLNTLLISISPFHNESIPFFKVSGVIEAAQRARVGVFPWVTDFMSDLSRFDPGKTHSLEEYTDIFGLCSGLSISIEDLGKPLSNKTYPILTTLYHYGIRGLVQMAADVAGFSPQKDLYMNKCDLCTEIRTLLVQKDYNGSEELNPTEFYSRR